MTLKNLTIKKALELLSKKELSKRELWDYYSSRAKEKDASVNAYIERFEYQEAQEGGALAGLPLAIKDNILIKGQVASAGSKMLENYVASYDASVIANLKKAGAVFFGRSNMDEFAMGSSTESSAYFPSKNPHDESRVPGGSSGGSAAAVAADMALAALGTDTGGSIRQPASFCGVVGFKPSYGAVSRFGIVAMGSSLDQVGPITRSVEDAKIIFEHIKGEDEKDATLVSGDEFEKRKELKFKKIAVPKKIFEKGMLSSSVQKNFEKSLNLLKEAGCEIKEVDMPALDYALATYYIIMPAEVSTNLARFDGLRYGLHVTADDYESSFKLSRAKGFGAETKRRILLGTFVLSSGYVDAYYYKAINAREYIKSEFKKLFEEFDVIATPTSPTTAFKLGEKLSDPLSMYAADIFTVPVNIAGLPAISLPSGKDEEKLPIGIQFISARFCDYALLDFAKDAEEILAYEP